VYSLKIIILFYHRISFEPFSFAVL